MENNNPIGLFDSGVGGLSILLELQDLLPLESTIFFADQAFVPYGKKSPEALIQRCKKIIDFFVEKKCKIVVIACNTATVYVIDELRKHFTIPIIGTVPAVKTLKAVTKTGRTAVLATPGTTKSPYLSQLINEFCSDIHVEKISGGNLEQLIEYGDLKDPKILKEIHHVLAPYFDQKIDSLALGCTHYPFLKKQIQDLWPGSITLVDSGKAIAKQVQAKLSQFNAFSTEKTTEKYFTSASIPSFQRAANALMQKNITQVNDFIFPE
jgi:glutamate racemase